MQQAIRSRALLYSWKRTFATEGITQPNPDKFNGLKVFQDHGAKVIASADTARALPEVQAYKKHFFIEVAKAFTDATYPKLGQVDLTFDKAYDLTLSGGETIHLRKLALPGVSTTQTIAFIPGANALIVGDLIHYKAHAWLEGGVVGGKPVPTLDTWIKDLEELNHLYRNVNPTVYGGRGGAVSLNIAVPEQITYLKKADQIVSSYVAALGARRSELRGADAGKHWQALAQKFEAAFPDYRFGYMIQYGIYGLALSK